MAEALAALGHDEDYDFETENLPCEFCDELFPMHLLTEHQTGCRPDLCRVVSKTDDVDQDLFSDNDEDEDYSTPDDNYNDAAQNSTKTTNPEVRKTDKIINFKVNEHDHKEDDKYEDMLLKNLAKSVNFNYKKSPVKKTTNDAIYNLTTKEVNQTLVSSTSQRKTKVVTSISTMVDDFGKSKDYTTNEIGQKLTVEEEAALSGDDDAVESIENFWRRAATVLKNRSLSENSKIKRQTDIGGKMTITNQLKNFSVSAQDRW